MIGTTPRVIVQRVRGAAPPRQPDTRLVEKARRSFRALNPARPRDILINDGPTCQPNLETSALSAGIPGGRPPPPRQGGIGRVWCNRLDKQLPRSSRARRSRGSRDARHARSSPRRLLTIPGKRFINKRSRSRWYLLVSLHCLARSADSTRSNTECLPEKEWQCTHFPQTTARKVFSTT